MKKIDEGRVESRQRSQELARQRRGVDTNVKAKSDALSAVPNRAAKSDALSPVPNRAAKSDRLSSIAMQNRSATAPGNEPSPKSGADLMKAIDNQPAKAAAARAARAQRGMAQARTSGGRVEAEKRAAMRQSQSPANIAQNRATYRQGTAQARKQAQDRDTMARYKATGDANRLANQKKYAQDAKAKASRSTSDMAARALNQRDATVAQNKYAYKAGTQAALRNQQAASQSLAYKRTGDRQAADARVAAAAAKPSAKSSQLASVNRAKETLARDTAFKQGADKIRSTTKYAPTTGGQQHPPVTPTGAVGGANPVRGYEGGGPAGKVSSNTLKALGSAPVQAAVKKLNVSRVAKQPAKSGSQRVPKGTSKAPLKNPNAPGRVGNWKNAETVSSYKKRMSMKEELVYNIIESNETEPLKAKVADKVKKEKNKKNTDIGGKTDIIDTEPKKPMMFGNQYR